MDLLSETKKICKQNNIQPTRSRGQNFLIKEEIYNNIVEASSLTSKDTVLEVGPGLGFLTRKIAQKARKIVSVELDDKIVDMLKKSDISKMENIELLNMNVLDYKPQFTDGYKIVANLPYNITSIFLRRFLALENKADLFVLMLQKEVAERIVARPGKMSLLAISIQLYAEPEILFTVPKDDFWPVPQVDSAVIRLKKTNPKRYIKDFDKEKEKKFFQIVKFGFSAKRKKLKNNLAAGLRIDQQETDKKLIDLGFGVNVRAQELSISDWVRVVNSF